MTKTHVLLISAAALALAALVGANSVGSGGGTNIVGGGKPNPTSPTALPTNVPHGQRTQLFRANAAGLTLEARLSSDRVLAGTSTVYVDTNMLAAAAEQTHEHVPVNFALAIDRSGSMSGQKLLEAKRAAQGLVAAMHEGDRLAIVEFGSDVRVFPSTVVTPSSRQELSAFVDRIVDSGGTNISGALETANAELRKARESFKVSRVILMSDGQPTEGETSPEALKELVARARRDDITTSAFGVGLDFNSRLMSGLAASGAGNYAFIEDPNHMAELFERDMKAAANTVARKVELEVRPRSGVTLTDVPGHEWSRSGTGFRVPLYDLSGGQTAQALLRLDLSGVPAEGAFSFGELALRFTSVADGSQREVVLPLSAEATTRQDDVTARADGPMVETVQRMEVAKQLAQAATAYESGQKDQAVSIFDNIRRQFGQSADALAGDDLIAVEKQMRSGGNEGSSAAKNLTTKTMKSFGQNNTY